MGSHWQVADFWNRARSRPRGACRLMSFDGGLGQLGLAQLAGQALVLAADGFAIDQQDESVFPAQFGATGGVLPSLK
jgi:hypothetical protein